MFHFDKLYIDEIAFEGSPPPSPPEGRLSGNIDILIHVSSMHRI